MKLVNKTHRFLALFVGLTMLVPLLSGSFTTPEVPFERKPTTANQMNVQDKKTENTMTRIGQTIRESGESLVKQFEITKGTKALDKGNSRKDNATKLIDLQDGSFDLTDSSRVTKN